MFRPPVRSRPTRTATDSRRADSVITDSFTTNSSVLISVPTDSVRADSSVLISVPTDSVRADSGRWQFRMDFRCCGHDDCSNETVLQWHMALSSKLLEILACPEDKGPLYYLEDESFLYNPRLNRRYDVRDGIPVMLIDEATNVDAAEDARITAKIAADGLKLSF